MDRLSSAGSIMSNCRLGRRATPEGLLKEAPKTRSPGLEEGAEAPKRPAVLRLLLLLAASGPLANRLSMAELAS